MRSCSGNRRARTIFIIGLSGAETFFVAVVSAILPVCAVFDHFVVRAAAVITMSYQRCVEVGSLLNRGAFRDMNLLFAYAFVILLLKAVLSHAPSVAVARRFPAGVCACWSRILTVLRQALLLLLNRVLLALLRNIVPAGCICCCCCHCNCGLFLALALLLLINCCCAFCCCACCCCYCCSCCRWRSC